MTESPFGLTNGEKMIRAAYIRFYFSVAWAVAKWVLLVFAMAALVKYIFA